jgi:hypothetical protein
MKEFNPVLKQEVSFSSIIYSPLVHFKPNQEKLPLPFMYSCLNLIYSDKILADLFDDIDQRVLPSMKDFVSNWFLQRFGCKEMSENIFKDFMSTLKFYQKSSFRFSIFVELCGLEELFEPESGSFQVNSLGINRANFRKIFMETSLAQRTLLVNNKFNKK